jgi:hypothetical protein
MRIQIRSDLDLFSDLDLDPNVWDWIRILALINDPKLTFLVHVIAINTLGISVS